MFGKIGLPELLLILAIVVILFGSTKIPQLGKGLGEGIRNFKKGLRSAEDETQQIAESTRSKDA
jgi:sec-independent protein translocase protein TatA